MNMRRVRDCAVVGGSMASGCALAWGLVAFIARVSPEWAAVVAVPSAMVLIFSAAALAGWVLRWLDGRKRVMS